MTARWSKIPAAEKTDLIELEMRLVISKSSNDHEHELEIFLSYLDIS